MRYLPGLIAISAREDLPILRLAYRAGHLSMRQLYESVYAGVGERMWNSFRWRVRRLAQHEFLVRTEVDGIGAVFALGRNGELFLQGKEPTIVERSSRTKQGNRRDQIWHDVDVFEIQVALRRAGVIEHWQFETEIRSQNDFTTSGYRKDYDAVVTFAVNGSTARVALEYERTCKSTPEYERICTELNLERRVSKFLYLARSLQLQDFLVHGFRMTTRRLYVGVAHEFCSNPLQARLIEVRGGITRCLEDCLNDSE